MKSFCYHLRDVAAAALPNKFVVVDVAFAPNGDAPKLLFCAGVVGDCAAPPPKILFCTGLVTLAVDDPPKRLFVGAGDDNDVLIELAPKILAAVLVVGIVLALCNKNEISTKTISLKKKKNKQYH